jgi:hypothetical protein
VSAEVPGSAWVFRIHSTLQLAGAMIFFIVGIKNPRYLTEVNSIQNIARLIARFRSRAESAVALCAGGAESV